MVIKGHDMPKRPATLSSVGLFLFLVVNSVAPANFNVSVLGTVKDAGTGDPLPSANVIIVGTSLGSATDVEGRYLIRNVPPGAYILRASYMGYQTVEVPLEVVEGESSTKDFELEPVALEGEEVVVTAQARGQNVAINTQLASNSIVSVVSSARIQELPDANAAEAIGRLPGVSVLRSGGEGTQIVIRGLQPKYNAVMVDGVRMASSNSSDRSADLSMISPHMLEGIEVTKAVTPDQDADVIGGTVNFKMREAAGEREGLGVDVLAQGGYMGLSHARNKYDNYKFVAGTEVRLFDKSFGVFAQVDLERRNLSSNELGAGYDQLNNNFIDYRILNLDLHDILRDRQRANGTLVMDYRLPEGKIRLMNFVSSGATDIHNRGESFVIGNGVNQHTYTLAFSQGKLSVLTNSLSFEHQILNFQVDAKLSHTYSETKNPDDWNVSFIQTSAGLTQFDNQANVDPKAVPWAANNNFPQTILSYFRNSKSFSRERALTGSLDLITDVDISDRISAVVKFGGKYRYQKRSYVFEQFGNNASFASPSARIAASIIASHFPSLAGFDPNSLPITGFVDPHFGYGKFVAPDGRTFYALFGGDYMMALPLNFGMLAEMADLLESNAAYINSQQPEGYARDNLVSTTNNYSGYEHQSAGYLMATINIGQEITIIPGIRYQRLQTTYTAPQGNQSSLSWYAYRHYDSTVKVSHDYWLPALIMRLKPLSWFDVRLSYTNTLAYPDYNAIVPRIDVASSGPIAWNNSHLTPSRSRNYDLYCSFYENSIGLLTVGGFLKQIDGLIYPWDFYVAGSQAAPYFPPGFSDTSSFTYHVYTYVNDPYRINNWGLELDWQTHFWYLPRPLDGLVLNVNYTHIFSRAKYPFTKINRIGRTLIYVDTSYTDRLLYQPNNIVNLSVGYDYAGFSIRLSMLYQADIFSGPNFWPQLRTTTSAYRRWDLSVKQDLPWFGLQLYGDLNNINKVNDMNVIQASTGVPRSTQSYGLSGNLGLRWRM